MQTQQGAIDRYYGIKGFWSYVRRAVSLDKEILLYFVLYATISLFVLPLMFFVLRTGVHHSNKGIVAVGGLAIFFLTMLNSRVFQFAIAYTVLERESGRSPTPIKAFLFLMRSLPLILKLAVASFVFTILVSTIAGIVGCVFRRGGDAIVRWVMDLLFSVAETSFQVFIGFLVPVAVYSKDKSLRGLVKTTGKVINGSFLGSMAINAKLQVVFILAMIPVLLSITILPEHASQPIFRIVLGSEFFLIVLFAQSVGLCTTLVYSRIAFLILHHGKTGPELSGEIDRMGVRF